MDILNMYNGSGWSGEGPEGLRCVCDETATAARVSALGYTTDEPTRKGYTGYEKDAESSLEFAQARYYSTTHGRYTSVDPLTASASIRNPQTFNRYTYVLNSPYKYTDPLGLVEECRTCSASELTTQSIDKYRAEEEDRRQKELEAKRKRRQQAANPTPPPAPAAEQTGTATSNSSHEQVHTSAPSQSASSASQPNPQYPSFDINMLIYDMFGRGSETVEGTVVTRSVAGLITDIRSAARAVFIDTIGVLQGIDDAFGSSVRTPGGPREMLDALQQRIDLEAVQITIKFGDKPEHSFRGLNGDSRVTGYYSSQSLRSGLDSIFKEVRIRATTAYMRGAGGRSIFAPLN